MDSLCKKLYSDVHGMWSGVHGIEDSGGGLYPGEDAAMIWLAQVTVLKND